MTRGGGRAVGAWTMLAAAGLVVAGTLLLNDAADALERQARELDPSESRLEATLSEGVGAAALLGAGLVVLLVGGIVLLVASARARRRGTFVEQPARALALVALLVTLLCLVQLTLLPSGPGQRALAAATGDGGTQVEAYEGTLSGVAGSPTAPEHLHVFRPSARWGEVQMRVGAGGGPVGGNAVAILEAAQADGTWREVARAKGPDTRVVVPYQEYPGDLRVRVRLDDGSVGEVRYAVALSFAPKP